MNIQDWSPFGRTGWISLQSKGLLRVSSNTTVQKPRKDPDAEKDWRQEEKGMTEDEMVGWHHQLSGHEFE